LPSSFKYYVNLLGASFHNLHIAVDEFALYDIHIASMLARLPVEEVTLLEADSDRLLVRGNLQKEGMQHVKSICHASTRVAAHTPTLALYRRGKRLKVNPGKPTVLGASQKLEQKPSFSLF
jgi:hypothetical protein